MAQPSSISFDDVLGLLAACSIGLLERSDAELVSWLKLRRVLNHKQYAKALRTIYGRL